MSDTDIVVSAKLGESISPRHWDAISLMLQFIFSGAFTLTPRLIHTAH